MFMFRLVLISIPSLSIHHMTYCLFIICHVVYLSWHVVYSPYAMLSIHHMTYCLFIIWHDVDSLFIIMTMLVYSPYHDMLYIHHNASWHVVYSPYDILSIHHMPCCLFLIMTCGLFIICHVVNWFDMLSIHHMIYCLFIICHVVYLSWHVVYLSYDMLYIHHMPCCLFTIIMTYCLFTIYDILSKFTICHAYVPHWSYDMLYIHHMPWLSIDHMTLLFSKSTCFLLNIYYGMLYIDHIWLTVTSPYDMLSDVWFTFRRDMIFDSQFDVTYCFAIWHDIWFIHNWHNIPPFCCHVTCRCLLGSSHSSAWLSLISASIVGSHSLCNNSSIYCYGP